MTFDMNFFAIKAVTDRRLIEIFICQFAKNRQAACGHFVFQLSLLN